MEGSNKLVEHLLMVDMSLVQTPDSLLVAIQLTLPYLSNPSLCSKSRSSVFLWDTFSATCISLAVNFAISFHSPPFCQVVGLSFEFLL